MTEKSRSERYMERQQQAGVVLVRVMVPESRKKEIAAIAKKMRDEHRSKQDDS